MGIFHFFGWFKKQFSRNIYKLNDKQNFDSIDVVIDNLMIDMNGLFHNSAQKVYQYGNFKAEPRLLKPNRPQKKISEKRLQQMVFQDTCQAIEKLLYVVNPLKRLILCVDGPAPYAKQIQQKRRRFRSAMDREEEGDTGFDSNNITPGTKFMDHFSKYIDWYIRKNISENPRWKNIEIIFSNEKVPGEGEHKILNYVRNYGSLEETYCLHGEDADLIMLSLGTHHPNFYILRNDTYDQFNKYFVINISNTGLQLGEIMRWKSEKYEYDVENAIDDFVFICFMVGNDFLPHIPSIEIIENGIDILLDIYREVGPLKGHIVKNKGDDIVLNKHVLKAFLETISRYEKPVLEKKLSNRRFYFPDDVLERCAVIEKNKITLDIDKYREDYIEKYFENKNLKKVVHSYLEGLHWVITYYKKGCRNWRWFYNMDYAPMSHTIAEHILSFNEIKYDKTFPLLPFQQLLCVLPPKSANLLPDPLDKLITDEESSIKEYYPDDFEIDFDGKKNSWQGIVILPMIDPELVIKVYKKKVGLISELDMKRNILGKSFTYNYNNDYTNTFKSYYGDIVSCKVKNRVIEL